ncbi:MAG: type II toxin-antitoxin system RelE family toxin [Candidatus Limnocylindria bacterium]
MAAWRVELTPAAARELRKASSDERVALRGVILALASDRHPLGARKLTARSLWRVRLRIDGAAWRVVYQVRNRDHLVVVTRVVRRDEGTYRRL